MTDLESHDDSLVDRARSFAIGSHKRINHRRKYSGAPYDVHLQAVYRILCSVTDDIETLAAGWLHDVVEDTAVTVEDLAAVFGEPVARLVFELTDISNPRDGNRAMRKAIDRMHLSRASARAKTIKLADLCDNAEDICESDPRFGRVFLNEMRDLLAVLQGGDARLHARALTILETYEERLGITARTPESVPATATSHDQAARIDSIVRMLDTFRVSDLARPLYSVDHDRDASSLQTIAIEHSWDLVAYRQQGRVVAYSPIYCEGSGRLVGESRPIEPSQVVDDDATLSSVVHLLTRHDFAFVRNYREICGVVSRYDFERPIGRMWLFGMVTVIESDLSERIRTEWPDGSWTSFLSAGRLTKANELREERSRRGNTVDLLDCLQLGDKISILIKDSAQLAALGFKTRSAAKDSIGDLEALRNQLAHSQAIVANYWHQVARLTRRFDEGISDVVARQRPGL